MYVTEFHFDLGDDRGAFFSQPAIPPPEQSALYRFTSWPYVLCESVVVYCVFVALEALVCKMRQRTSTASEFSV
jgi:hypothetical protein